MKTKICDVCNKSYPPYPDTVKDHKKEWCPECNAEYQLTVYELNKRSHNYVVKNSHG